MTEYNIFCYSKSYNDENSFQQERYRAFNEVVGKDRYNEISSKVCKILGSKNILLSDFWRQVTQEQWRKLLAIPEAKDFKEGFEYISGQKINISNKVKIECEGKVVEISRESAVALKLID